MPSELTYILWNIMESIISKCRLKLVYSWLKWKEFKYKPFRCVCFTGLLKHMPSKVTIAEFFWNLPLNGKSHLDGKNLSCVCWKQNYNSCQNMKTSSSRAERWEECKGIYRYSTFQVTFLYCLFRETFTHSGEARPRTKVFLETHSKQYNERFASCLTLLSTEWAGRQTYDLHFPCSADWVTWLNLTKGS